MRLFQPPHACFRCAHSSASLPLQSAAYASASTRSLCAPQRAHNAVSFCPVCSAAGSNASRVPVQSTGLEIRRARDPPATPARSRTFSHARRSPPQCASPHNLRALRAQPLLSKFFTFTFLPPVASRAKSVWPARSCPPAAAALPESKKWGCTEVARLLASQQTSLLGNSCSFDCGCRDTPLTAAVGTHRLSRALGPTDDQAGDRLGSVGMRGLTPRGKDAPCAAESLPLVTRLLLLPLARIETHDAARARGCWRSSTTVSPHVLYCVPTNPGPRSFRAWPVRRCHWRTS